MKGKQAVLDELCESVELVREIENSTLTISRYKRILFDELEGLRDFIEWLESEEEILRKIETLREYEEGFGTREHSTELIHILNRVLKEDIEDAGTKDFSL